MFPKCFLRPTALIVAVCVGSWGCGRPIPSFTSTDSEPAKEQVAFIGSSTEKAIKDARDAIAKLSKPVIPETAPEPTGTQISVPSQIVDSYEAFLEAFHLKVKRPFSEWREELLKAIAAHEEAVNKVQPSPDANPLREKIEELDRQRDQFSERQVEALTNAAGLLDQYDAKAKVVAELVGGALKASEPIRSALRQIDVVVEKIRLEKLPSDQIDKIFAADGEIAKQLLVVEESRAALETIWDGLNSAIDDASAAYKSVVESLELLTKLINDPELKSKVEEYEKENEKFWQSVPVIAAFIVDPLLGLLMLLLGALSGGGGNGGEGGGPPGSGDNEPGNAESPSPANPSESEGGVTGAQSPIPEEATSFPIKFPEEGEHAIFPYEDESGRWLLIHVQKDPAKQITLPFSLDKYGPKFSPLVGAGGELEIKSVEVLHFFPVTMTLNANGAEYHLRWANETTPPELFSASSATDVPEGVTPLPTLAIGNGDYRVLLAARGENRFYIVSKGEKSVELIVPGGEGQIVVPGKEHRIVVKAIEVAGPSMDMPYPITLVIVRANDDGHVEEFDVKWEQTGGTPAVIHGKP